jgi:hypothetical protein
MKKKELTFNHLESKSFKGKVKLTFKFWFMINLLYFKLMIIFLHFYLIMKGNFSKSMWEKGEKKMTKRLKMLKGDLKNNCSNKGNGKVDVPFHMHVSWQEKEMK